MLPSWKTTPVEVFETILAESSSDWVLFENDTCVRFDAGSPGVAERARTLLKEFGLVVPGSQLADFSSYKLTNFPGWIVTCHHPDIITYVSCAELTPETGSGALRVGLIGRGKRNRDAHELHVVHVSMAGHVC
jgi:hypothetical protein